jgi:hypothetical protein
MFRLLWVIFRPFKKQIQVCRCLQCIPGSRTLTIDGEFISPAVPSSSFKVSDIFVRINQITIFPDRFFLQVPNIKFYGNPSSGSRADTWRIYAEWQTDVSKLIGDFHTCGKSLKTVLLVYMIRDPGHYNLCTLLYVQSRCFFWETKQSQMTVLNFMIAWPCIIDTNNIDNQIDATITVY